MKSPLTAMVKKIQQLNSELSETFPRVVQVVSTNRENPTWTILGNVSCVTTQNYTVEIFTMAVNGESILPYL